MSRAVILAKLGTNERVVGFVGLLEEVGGLMKDMNKLHGGDWVYIQDVKPYEVVPFTASKVYLGFDDNKDGDYCGNIIKLKT